MPPLDFLKPITSLAFAGSCWIAETATPPIPGVPDWVTSLGLPVAMLIAVIYALVSTNKALSESQKGRLTDRDGYLEKLEKNLQASMESRERLIRATDEQTREFKSLAGQLASRPCQLPKDR
jgi:hypothetical protein